MAKNAGNQNLRRLPASYCLALAMLVVTAGAPCLSAQVKRLVYVTVTDPLNRFVIGLERENFEVVENGAGRAISGFFGVDSALAIAIVSDTPIPAAGRFNAPEEALIQTQSLSTALRQLAASASPRKALVVTTGADTKGIAADIQVFETGPDSVMKTLVEIRNRYLLQIESSAPNANFEVTVKPPRGLPPLRANWK